MAEKKLEVAIAAGGTAGHVNPALALAEELTSRGHHVTFYGQPTRLEAKLVPEAGFDFVPISVRGFDRSRPWTLVTALWKIRAAKSVLGKRFSQVGAPDVAVGFGAYVELPLLDWCHGHGVPIVIHEQNSVPGLANKTSAKKATRVCVAFPAATKVFEPLVADSSRVCVTGNPVRRSVVEADGARGRADHGVPADARMLLVFGGSLGAAHLNSAVANLKGELLSREDVHVIHSTGADGYDATVEALALTPDERQRYQVVPYIKDMGNLLAAADLVVSRAGASSIAEISALAVPSILVPYPFATADHQTTNAHLLVDCGAARLVMDDELDSRSFSATLLGLLDDADELARMRESARGLASAGAASVLADRVEEDSTARA